MSSKDTPCPCNRKGVFHRLRSSTAIRYTIKQEEPPKVSVLIAINANEHYNYLIQYAINKNTYAQTDRLTS